MSLSPLEAQFQRVADELTRRWPGPELEPYLDQLIYDPRGRRQGFPFDVMSELLFLAELRWWMKHDSASDAAVAAESFSFGGPRKT